MLPGDMAVVGLWSGPFDLGDTMPCIGGEVAVVVESERPAKRDVGIWELVARRVRELRGPGRS